MFETIHCGNGKIEFRSTPWDQKVLGLKTNEIQSVNFSSLDEAIGLIQSFEQYCASEGFAFTVLRIDAADRLLKKLLQDHGYYFVETSFRIIKTDTQSYDFTSGVQPKIKIEAPSSAHDYSEIQEIARSGFFYGRLMEDPNVNAEQARQRNANWIDNLREQNCEFSITRYNGHVAGFHIQKVILQETEMILTGMALEASLLAVPFWAAVMEDLKNRNVRRIQTIVSAANVSIVNLYSFFRFKIQKTLFGFHKFRRIQ